MTWRCGALGVWPLEFASSQATDTRDMLVQTGSWSLVQTGSWSHASTCKLTRASLLACKTELPHSTQTSPCSSSRVGLPAETGPLAAIVTPKWISSRRLCHKEMASQKVGCNPPQIPTTGPLREPRICTSRCHLQLRPGRNAHTPPPARNQSDKAQSRYGFIFLLMEPCSEGGPLKEDLGENIFLRVLTLEANPYLRGSWRADTLTVLVRHTTP